MTEEGAELGAGDRSGTGLESVSLCLARAEECTHEIHEDALLTSQSAAHRFGVSPPNRSATMEDERETERHGQTPHVHL